MELQQDGDMEVSHQETVTGVVGALKIAALTAMVLSVFLGCSNPTGPTGPTKPILIFTLEDGCDDGYRVDYRFFEYDGTRRTQSWPGDDHFWYTPGFGREVTHRLAGCSAGRSVCLGARTRDGSRGVGFNGDRSCERCCAVCPVSGEATVRPLRLVCNRS